jgi:hypothetical protein
MNVDPKRFPGLSLTALVIPTSRRFLKKIESAFATPSNRVCSFGLPRIVFQLRKSIVTIALQVVAALDRLHLFLSIYANRFWERVSIMPFSRPLCAHVLLATMILSSSPHAFAKAPKESAAARAERSSGTVALNLGRYDEAAQHFEAAYTLTQDPALLFSLGQAYRLAGKPEKALAAYNSFLRASTYSPKNRSQYEITASEIAVITSLLMMRISAPATAPDTQLDDLMKARAEKLTPPETLEPPPIEKEDESQDVPAVAQKDIDPPKADALSGAAVAATQATNSQPAGVFLAVTEAPPPPQGNKKAVYKRWWFWPSVVGALALGGAATWWLLRPESTTPPSTWGAQRVLP